MAITDPITSGTVRQILECGWSTVRYYADRGRIRFQELPSGLRIYERADAEQIAHERR